MTIENMVKTLQNIMRQDAGINGDATRIEQIVWILFLKVYSDKEAVWELHDDDYKSIIPENLRWENWAVDNKDGLALTGEELLKFVDQELLPTLKNLDIDENTPKKSAIVKYIFEDTNNYMKNGVLLRQVINVINEIDFTEAGERHHFNDIYETILKDLQSAGNSGEFYTPRPLTDFIAKILNPKLGETVADFAMGTGGFLISALNILSEQIKIPADKEVVNKSIYGIEKKGLPYLLCMTNLLLHDVDEPNIEHMNSLSRPVRDYSESEKFNVILMNPPYGGIEEKSIQSNFPTDMQSSETADLFMSLIIYRLKTYGRAGIIVPDGFLFGNDNAKIAIKTKLLNECNLHTIVRLPAGVFAPYTSITTNVLFFDKTGPTKEIWTYEIPLPESYNSFSKTKPFLNKHTVSVKEWWKNRETEDINAFKTNVENIKNNNYNLDLKNPKKIVEEENMSLNEMLNIMTEKSENLVNLIILLSKEFEGIENHRTNSISNFEEQQRIVKKTENILSKNDIIKEKLSLSEIIKKIKEKTLSLAIQGKLVPQDKNDEPASELLKQIKNTKQQLIKEGMIKKEKPTEISSNWKFFNIPESWEWVKLNSICLKITDGEHIKPKTVDDGFPLLTAKNILENNIDFKQIEYIDKNAAEKSWARCNPEKNDILICSRGTIGRNTIIKSDIHFCIMGTVILLKLYQNYIDSNYINLCLKDKSVQNKMKGMSGATAVSALYLKDIQNLFLPLPPLDEQHRIVQKVEEIMNYCDKIEELLN